MPYIRRPIGVYELEEGAPWSFVKILLSVLFIVFFGVVMFKYNNWIDIRLSKYLFLNHLEFYNKHFDTFQFFLIVFLFAGCFKSVTYLKGWRKVRRPIYISDAPNFPGPYQNINRLLDYRNAYMGTQGNDKNAQLYVDTGWVDGMLSNPQGENTQRTLRYLDGMLGTMGNKEGVDYLKNMNN